MESVSQACRGWNLICLAVQHGGDSDLCASPGDPVDSTANPDQSPTVSLYVWHSNLAYRLLLSVEPWLPGRRPVAGLSAGAGHRPGVIDAGSHRLTWRAPDGC